MQQSGAGRPWVVLDRGNHAQLARLDWAPPRALVIAVVPRPRALRAAVLELERLRSWVVPECSVIMPPEITEVPPVSVLIATSRLVTVAVCRSR